MKWTPKSGATWPPRGRGHPGSDLDSRKGGAHGWQLESASQKVSEGPSILLPPVTELPSALCPNSPLGDTVSTSPPSVTDK